MKKTLKNMMQLHVKQTLKQGIYVFFWSTTLTLWCIKNTILAKNPRSSKQCGQKTLQGKRWEQNNEL
jgi:hypothetical protein